MSEIRIDTDYPHPPRKVWRALTDSRAIAQWLMPNDFEPRVGHRFKLRAEPAPGFDGIVQCEVLELDEPRRLSFSWKGGPIDTIATFELEPIATGTRLRLTQSGFAGFKANLVRLILKTGSREIYRKHLPALLDRMADDGTLRPAPQELACEQRGLWKVLASLFALIPRHGNDARGNERER